MHADGHREKLRGEPCGPEPAEPDQRPELLKGHEETWDRNRQLDARCREGQRGDHDADGGGQDEGRDPERHDRAAYDAAPCGEGEPPEGSPDERRAEGRLHGRNPGMRDPRQQDARNARYGSLRDPVREPVAGALARQGITRLYVHQTEALEAVRAGESVIITTGTASGKSLCYMVPVLETLVDDPPARALFVYPTKALAQDQLGTLGEFGMDLRFGSYDGDTPQAE